MEYWIVKILVVGFCVCGLLYFGKRRRECNDPSSSKKEIINYFKEQQAVSVESGIKIKDLPEHIAKDPNLLTMVSDRTLKFKKGKYYLNI